MVVRIRTDFSMYQSWILLLVAAYHWLRQA